MSDPSINDIVKHDLYESTSHERDWWTKASNEARSNILRGKIDFTDITTITENAYQQEHKAKFNQLVNTKYDSLPSPVRATITEALIVEGELPNPSVYKGIGREFIANPWSTTKEVFTECDRCDETFMDEEDFNTHKEIDHGDDPEDFDKVEETYTLTMNPDMTRESLREARKLLAETKEKDLYRDAFFNAKDIKEPTVTEPDDVKGTVGYNDNPNEGLYDTKKFTTGKSTSRYGGVVSEALVEEGGVGSGPQGGSALEPEQIAMKQINPDYDAFSKDTGNMYDSPMTEAISEEDLEEDLKNKGWDVPKHHLDNLGLTDNDSPDEAISRLEKQEKDYDNESHSDNEATPTEITTGSDKDEDYDGSAILAGDDVIEIPSATGKDPANALDDVDYSEEAVEYVYPTKATEAFVEEKDPFIDGYGDDDMESEKEAVEAQVISRKLHGHNDQTIARELVMQYGIPHEEALQKSYSIEVSTNDKVANTFFGKRFSECTEAEIDELKLYGGN